MKLAKNYEPAQYEPTIYALWETSGAFEPTGDGEPFSIILPPPNANGKLHAGHALSYQTQDILVRYWRMRGRASIFLPGADHAGFETWTVYEKELAKKGQSRFDFSREQLYSQVWNFVDEKRGDMELALRSFGLSASWENLTFTLDKKVIDTVYDTFEKMWKDELIYRGERIVNYCTTHQTGFADIEIVHKNVKTKIWDIAYPLLDKIGEIVVATTRPETLLGDVAIAVHPDDERYRDLVGTRAIVPIVGREIPIVADEYVDKDFGTGAVKITPYHDPNDFEVGQRHKLTPIQVIGFDGKMMNAPAQFKGMNAEEARVRVLELLKNDELLRGEKAIEHTVSHCYKCDSIIQPLLKDQWFVKIRPLAQRAKRAIEAGEISFTPQRGKKLLTSYYDNLRDWNLSRQIPWGIPIPAFQNVADEQDWIFDRRVDEKTIVIDGKTYRREEDTFDTWFSSGQWPYITTNALQPEDPLARFYPNSVMMTGQDILYPWISRMILLGLYRTDKVPFKNVYLSGLVLDKHGAKMSKSKGNVIDPMEVLGEYGSDALRLGIIASRSAGQDQAFLVEKIVAGRNFCNKLWNIARYIEDKLGEDFVYTAPTPKSLADHWVVRELHEAAEQASRCLESYRFAEASEIVYHAVWDIVADWFIEASKAEEHPEMLAWVLDTSLKIVHPFAPFVTETIWQTVPWHNSLLMNEPWPLALEYSDIAAAEFEQLQMLVNEIRFVVADLPGNKKYHLLYHTDTLVSENEAIIVRLARLKSAQQIESIDAKRGVRLANSNREAWLDIDAETLYEHQTNLEVRLMEARAQVKNLTDRLSNERYVAQAPAHLVQESQHERVEKMALIERLEREINTLAQQ